MHTRAENLYINVQQRLQQTVLNNHETRMLLAQYESYRESQRILVITHTHTHTHTHIYI